MLKVFPKTFFYTNLKRPWQEMLKSAYETEMYTSEFVLGNCIFVKIYKKR